MYCSTIYSDRSRYIGGPTFLLKQGLGGHGPKGQGGHHSVQTYIDKLFYGGKWSVWGQIWVNYVLELQLTTTDIVSFNKHNCILQRSNAN